MLCHPVVMALDPTIKALLGAMTAMNAPPMSQGTAQHAREQFRTLTVGLRQPQWVVPVGNVEDTTFAGPTRELAARVY